VINWVDNVLMVKNILIRGKEASEQINILGDDGVPINYHVDFWKSEVIDFVILQQDAFDPVDRSCPISRQKYMLEKVLEVYYRNLNSNLLKR
jgi:V/A-type H+/Na+-transporting ATPase subunit A